MSTLPPDVRAFLEAVLEAIGIPAPAAADDPEYARVLTSRSIDASIMLRYALGDGAPDLAWAATDLRQQLSIHSAATYEPEARTGGAK